MSRSLRKWHCRQQTPFRWSSVNKLSEEISLFSCSLLLWFLADGSFVLASSALTGRMWDGTLWVFSSMQDFKQCPNLDMVATRTTAGITDVLWWGCATMCLETCPLILQPGLVCPEVKLMYSSDRYSSIYRQLILNELLEWNHVIAQGLWVANRDSQDCNVALCNLVM